jgi:hypothetical protein
VLPRAWTSLGPLGRAGGVLLSIGLIVALAALLLKWAPEWLVSGGLKGKDRAEDVGRLRTAILATLAGVLASIGAYYTHRTLKLNRENLEHNRETAARSHALDQVRQITERFTRAIDQLGDRDRLDVRLGGIYALERIARDSVDITPRSWKCSPPSCVSTPPGGLSVPKQSLQRLCAPRQAMSRWSRSTLIEHGPGKATFTGR